MDVSLSRRQFAGATGIALLGALIGADAAAAAADDDVSPAGWPRRGYDLGHTSAATDRSGPRTAGHVRYAVRIPDEGHDDGVDRGIEAPVVVSDGVAYVSGQPGDRDAASFYAVDVETGAVRWKRTENLWNFAALTALEGSLYYLTGGRALRSVDAADGTERWTVDHPNREFISLAVDEGAAYAVAHAAAMDDYETFVQIFDPESGELRRGRSLEATLSGDGRIDPIDDNVALSDDLLFLGCRDLDGEGSVTGGRFVALDRSTLELVWERRVSDVITGPVYDDGRVYCYARDANSLYAVSADDGTTDAVVELERPEEGMNPHRGSAVADGKLYLRQLHGVGAYDPFGDAPGESEWTFETEDQVQQCFAVVGETVYAGTQGGALYALDRATGEERWSFEASGWGGSSPAVVGGSGGTGTLLVGDRDSTLYALGEEQREPTATVDGRVLDAEGTPVAGVEVQVRDLWGGEFDATVATGDDGAYAVDLPRGEYRIVAEKTDAEAIREISLDDGEARTVDFELDVVVPENSESGEEQTDDGSPGFGAAGALAGLVGAGCLLGRAGTDDDADE